MALKKTPDIKTFIDFLEKNKNINIDTLSIPYQGMTKAEVKKSIGAYKVVGQVWSKYTPLGTIVKQNKEAKKDRRIALLKEAREFKYQKKYNIAKNQVALTKINQKLLKMQSNKDRGAEVLKGNVMGKFMEATPLGQFFGVAKGALEELGFSFNKKQNLEDKKAKLEAKEQEWKKKEFIPAEMKFVDAIEQFTKSLTGEPTTLEKRQMKENERKAKREKKKDEKVEKRKERASNKNTKAMMKSNSNVDKDMDELIANTDPKKADKEEKKKGGKFDVSGMFKDTNMGRRMIGGLALFSGLGKFAEDFNKGKAKGKNGIMSGIIGEEYQVYDKNKKGSGFLNHKKATGEAVSKKNFEIMKGDLSKYASLGYGLGSTFGDEKTGLMIGGLTGAAMVAAKWFWAAIEPYLIDFGNLFKWFGDYVGGGIENFSNMVKEWTGTTLTEDERKRIEELNEERNKLNRELLGEYTETRRLQINAERDKIKQEKKDIYDMGKSRKEKGIVYKRGLDLWSQGGIGDLKQVKKESKSVQDFIIRPNGQVLKSDPDDTIFGVKNFSEKTIDKFNEASLSNISNKISFGKDGESINKSIQNEIELINLMKDQNKILEELLNNSGRNQVAMDFIHKENMDITRHFMG